MGLDDFLSSERQSKVVQLIAFLPGLWILILYLNTKASAAKPKLFERKWILKCEGDKISSIDYNQKEASIILGNIQSIIIETNDKGPMETDVWWKIEDKNGITLVPGGATGESEMLKSFGTLDGFNHKAVIDAMGCTQNKIFLVYSRR